MEDEGNHGNDETRLFILSSLAQHHKSRVTCVLCEDSMLVFDRYPLVDGTFFLSPKQHSPDCIEVSFFFKKNHISVFSSFRFTTCSFTLFWPTATCLVWSLFKNRKSGENEPSKKQFQKSSIKSLFPLRNNFDKVLICWFWNCFLGKIRRSNPILNGIMHGMPGGCFAWSYNSMQVNKIINNHHFQNKWDRKRESPTCFGIQFAPTVN